MIKYLKILERIINFNFIFIIMRIQEHYFTYFSKIHIQSLAFSIFFAYILLIIPKIFKMKNKNQLNAYATFLGFFALFCKIGDSIYRYVYQGETLPEVLLLYLCNFVVVLGALYLITKNKNLFSVTYFLSFGSIFALLLPGISYYHNDFYIYIFTITHTFIPIIVIYGFIYLKETITKKDFITGCIGLSAIFIYAMIYNSIFKTDAMFLKNYITPFFSFIKPFWLYRIVLVSCMFILSSLMYLPFRHKTKRL